MCASCGHLLAQLEHLVDLLLVLDDGKRTSALLIGKTYSVPPRPGTAAPAPRPAPARPASRRTGAAGSRRSPPRGRRASRRARPCRRPAAHQRASAPGQRLPDAVFLLAQRRRIGRASRARATGGERWSAPMVSWAMPAVIVGKALTPTCRCDDNPRVSLTGISPMPSTSFPSASDAARCGVALARHPGRELRGIPWLDRLDERSAPASSTTCAWCRSSPASWCAASAGR
jgi:hypothetical protein